MYPKTAFKGFAFLIVCISPLFLSAQPTNKFFKDVTMPPPNAAALGAYSDIPVSYFTGVPNISIPLYTASEGPLSLPISLSYHGGGIRVAEPAPWTGLGWTVGAGGLVSRTMLNLPDEIPLGYKNTASTLKDPVQTWADLIGNFSGGDIGTDQCPPSSTDSVCIKVWELADQLMDAKDGQLDTEPDVFSYNLGGYSGKFVMDKNGVFYTVPRADVKIEYTVDTWITQFVITTPDGVRYTLGKNDGETGRTGLEFSYPTSGGSPLTNCPVTWYLRKIETPDKKYSIELNYTPENYSYKVLGSRSITYNSNAPGNGILSQGEFALGNNKQGHVANITGWKLASITTTTETITFVANTDRTDLDNCQYSTTQYPTSKKALDAVQIATGTFCKRFEFQYDYYVDANYPNDSYSKRLRLKSLTEKSCDGTVVNPPHKFTYKAGNLINRLSYQTDHWGYFNGKSGNESGYGIPPAGFIDQSGQFFTPPIANANRTSSEPDMLVGVLDTLKYPTGGYTKFTFEANRALVYGGSGSGGSSGTNCATEVISQSLSNCSYPSADCCPQSLVQASVPDTFTSLELSDAKIRMILKNLNGPHSTYCNPNNPTPPNAWIRFTIKRASDNQTMFSQEFNISQSEYTQDFPVPYTITAGVGYHLILETKHGKGTGYLFKCVSGGGSGGGDGGAPVEMVLGGLRIKEIKTHDGVSTANDIIKTYEYKNPFSPTAQSSGVLYYMPTYAVKAERLGDNYVLANIVTAASIAPLTNFNGNHVGYTYVTELINGIGKKRITNISEQWFANYSKSPTPPVPFCVRDGFQREERVFDQNNVVKSVSGQYHTTSEDSYFGIPGVRYKLATYPVGNQSSGIFESYAVTTYALRTAALRVKTQVDTLDGVGSVTTYFYDSQNRFLAPVALETVNSDGKVHRTEHKYVHDYTIPYMKTDLVNKNIISVPFETVNKVDGTIVSGSRTQFWNFYLSNGNYYTSSVGNTFTFVRPRRFEQYEMTWNGGVPTTGAWVSKDTILSYDAYGNVKQNKLAWWPVENYTWTASGQIQTRSYLNFTWQYAYYSGTNVLQSITDKDGQVSSFEYDKLTRLSKATSRGGNVVTDYTYHFKDAGDPHNWVKSKVTYAAVTIPGSSLSVQENFQYFDGIGRLIETVAKQQSPAFKDVVTYVKYDNKGRQTHQYNPFESTLNTGAFVSTPPVNTPFTFTQYDSSMLSRPVSVTPPGWYASTTKYGFNTATDTVKLNHATGTVYPANTLSKTEVTDPENLRTITFKDKKGRTVLVRRTDDNNYPKADTYYQYDDKDRQTLVIPPGAAYNSTNLTFQYTYDAADRMLTKKVPDAGVVTMKYNNRDLLVLEQDGVLATQNKWKCTRYDDYGRPLRTGLYSGAAPGYIPLALEPSDVYVKNYYDGTTAIEKGRLKRDSVRVFDAANTWLVKTYTFDAFGRTKSSTGNNYLMPTDMTAEIAKFGYDNGDNLLSDTIITKQSASVTHTIIQKHTYDQWSRNKQNTFKINADAEQTVSELTYDWKGQLREKNLGKKTISSTTSYLQSVDYFYNAMGWLRTINAASLGGTNTALQNCAVAPNPGGMSFVTNPDGNDLFHLDLRYDTTDLNLGGTGWKNGNISQAIWRVRGRERQSYTLGYDFLSRMTVATFKGLSDANVVNNNGAYNENLQYDLRGNITTLQRTGKYKPTGQSCWSDGTIDQLTFTYYSGYNRLQKVADAAAAASKPYGWHNTAGALSTASYLYDANGNLVSDPYKGMSVVYNFLNLPRQMLWSDAGTGAEKIIDILYDAKGRKLRKTVTDNTTLLYRQDYSGNLEYRFTTANGLQPEAAYFGDGRVAFIENYRRYEYYIKDHLGNIRLTFTDKNNNGVVDVNNTANNEILQENHFYPFGMDQSGPWMNDAALDNAYKYNGKELHTDFGLGWYAFEARWYDPQVGRFPGVDPIIEKFAYLTPYNYASNDPVTKIDLWGLQGTRGEITQRQYQEGAVGEGVLAGQVDKDDLMPLYRAQAGGVAVGAGAGLLGATARALGPGGIAKEGLDYVWEQITGVPAMTSLADIGEAGAKLFLKKEAKNTAQEIAEGAGKEAAEIATREGAQIGNKLDFVFGKATGSKHNIDRSKGMLRQLESIGVFDNKAGRTLMQSHLEKVHSGTKGIQQENGRELRESLLMGPNGGLKVESIWQEKKLITIKLIGGK